MKKIYNNIIPFPGYKAMTVWPVIFVRSDAREHFGIVDENHESIHGAQQKEMLVVGAVITLILFLLGCCWWSLLALPVFFWWYIIEWFIRFFMYSTKTEAYRNISFEQEAYLNESYFHFLSKRKCFGWVRYIRLKTYIKNTPDYRNSMERTTDLEMDNF